MKIIHKIETYTSDGKPVLRFTVMNSSGAYMEFTNWGARWITASVPDVQGALANILIGYDTLSDYLKDSYYMGATVGRFANRIADASFTIDRKTFHLEVNDGNNTNHGGFSGFHNKVWQWEELPDGIRFSLYSPDGEGGFPGNIHVITDYRFNEDNELSVRHYAETDCATYINMTNHAYFNLCGNGKKITEHRLHISSDRILDTTSAFIPTGSGDPHPIRHGAGRRIQRLHHRLAHPRYERHRGRAADPQADREKLPYHHSDGLRLDGY